MLLPAHGESKGKIGVFIEDHFDMTEYRLFNKRFPAAGFDLEYITNLWGNPTLQFGSNPDNGWVEEHITVSKDVKDVNPSYYKGFLLIGAYATDRLRYTVQPAKEKPNDAPVSRSLKKMLDSLPPSVDFKEDKDREQRLKGPLAPERLRETPVYRPTPDQAPQTAIKQNFDVTLDNSLSQAFPKEEVQKRFYHQMVEPVPQYKEVPSSFASAIIDFLIVFF